MNDEPARIPGQPKLRSSCDACGASKLRCDRGQPECRRCISLGLECVYGVSRKMGKPPRAKHRIPEASSASHTSAERAGGQTGDRKYSCSAGSSGGFDGTVLSSGPVYDYMSGVDALDALSADMFGSMLPDLTSLEYGDGLSSNIDTGPRSSLGSLMLEGFSTPATQTDASVAQVDESRYLDSTLQPPAGNTGHGCLAEAYEILGSLSLDSPNNAPCISQSSPASASASGSATPSIAQCMSLDHILHLNREASERLFPLLACPCAKFPHLTLLYASIISRILMWYQQAAGCTKSAAGNVAAIMSNTPSSASGSGGASPWSSAAGSTLRMSTGHPQNIQTSTQSTRLAVAPGKMAIGTFNVDDLRVETALKMQLLSGEMRRAERLVDQFTSRNSSGQPLPDEYAFSGVDNLYPNLDSWLRSEHSRIANMMRSKLRELNN